MSSQGGLIYQLYVISGRGMWLILSRNYVKYHKDEKAQFNASVLKLCKHALSVINIVRFFPETFLPPFTLINHDDKKLFQSQLVHV